MHYEPMTDQERADWIKWLQSQRSVLNKKENVPTNNSVFETGTGDVNAAKDMCGKFLATMTNERVTIE